MTTQSPADGSLDKPVAAEVGWEVLGTRFLWRSSRHGLREDRVRLPNGQEINYTYHTHPGFVVVVPVTPDGRVVLERHYRYTVDDWCWEVPAGGLGDRSGQALEAAARDELREEVGGSAEHLEYMGWHYGSNGTSDEIGHIFLATGVRLDQELAQEPTELLEIQRVPIVEVVRMAEEGEMTDGQSALAILRCRRRLLELVE